MNHNYKLFFVISITLNIIILTLTLVNKTDINKLSGYWYGIDEDNKVYGFQFQHSDDFGYYTVVKIEEDELLDSTKIGYYNLENNIIQFHFKQSVVSDDTVKSINELEEWYLSYKDKFLTFHSKDNSIKILLQRIN